MAFDVTALLEEQAAYYGVDGLMSPVEGLSVDTAASFLDAGRIFSFLWDGLCQAFQGEAGMICAVLGLCLFAALVQALSVGNHVETLTVFVAAGVLFAGFYRSGQVLASAVEVLSGFLVSFLPVFFGVCGAAGAVGTVALAGGSLCAVAGGLSAAMTGLVLPGVRAYFAIGLGASLSRNKGLCGVSDTVYKCLLWCVGLFSCGISGVTVLQKVVAIGGDSVSKRLSKFAAGNLIPVVGGTVGDSMDLLYACAGRLQGNVGAFGVLCAVFVLLQPMLGILVQYLAISLAAALSGGFDCGGIGTFLHTAKQAFALLLAVCIGVLLMLAVGIGVMTG